MQPWFIDHGYMFGGPEDRIRGKMMAPRFLDSRIYGDMPVEKLSAWVRAIQTLNHEVYWQLIESIPGDWQTAKALSAFARFLSRLRDKDLAAIFIQRMDTINRVFLRLRSEGKQQEWRAHIYGNFYPTAADESGNNIVTGPEWKNRAFSDEIISN